MLSKFRKLSRLGAATAAALALTTLTPGTATAASWWYNPNSCTNIKTLAQSEILKRTVQVRYGWCDGHPYAWARVIGYVSGSSDAIQLQVDINNDRVRDIYDTWNATARNFTRGYSMVSVAGRHFRACYLQGSTLKGCTAWVYVPPA